MLLDFAEWKRVGSNPETRSRGLEPASQGQARWLVLRGVPDARQGSGSPDHRPGLDPGPTWSPDRRHTLNLTLVPAEPSRSKLSR